MRGNFGNASKENGKYKFVEELGDLPTLKIYEDLHIRPLGWGPHRDTGTRGSKNFTGTRGHYVSVHS